MFCKYLETRQLGGKIKRIKFWLNLNHLKLFSATLPSGPEAIRSTSMFKVSFITTRPTQQIPSAPFKELSAREWVWSNSWEERIGSSQPCWYFPNISFSNFEKKHLKFRIPQVGTSELGAQYHSDLLYVGLTWLAPGLRSFLLSLQQMWNLPDTSPRQTFQTQTFKFMFFPQVSTTCTRCRWNIPGVTRGKLKMHFKRTVWLFPRGSDWRRKLGSDSIPHGS